MALAARALPAPSSPIEITAGTISVHISSPLLMATFYFAAFVGDLIIRRSVIGPSLKFYFGAHPGTAVTHFFTFCRTRSLGESYLTFITC